MNCIVLLEHYFINIVTKEKKKNTTQVYIYIFLYPLAILLVNRIKLKLLNLSVQLSAWNLSFSKIEIDNSLHTVFICVFLMGYHKHFCFCKKKIFIKIWNYLNQNLNKTEIDKHWHTTTTVIKIVLLNNYYICVCINL